MMKEDIEDSLSDWLRLLKDWKRRVRISIRESFQTEPRVVTYL